MIRMIRNFWWLVLGVALGLFVIYLLTRRRETLPAPHAAAPLPRGPVARAPSPETPPPPASEPSAPASTVPDDLTRIDGIGPAYARALNALGITTFAQLAQADPDALAAQIDRLTAERIRRDDWIGQATALSRP